MATGFRAAILAGAILLAASPAQAERRVALVIGNAAYAEMPLKNPVNDARAMARTLKARGFEVIARENANKQAMEQAVAEFGEKLSEGAVGLFFFAGHGMQVNGRNFLVPVEAKITSEQRVRLETVDVDVVLDQMVAARSRVNMVVLDACRNNPFERRFRSAAGGLAQINAPEGTLIAYATAPGKVASDGDGANGLYTAELLRAMAQPGLKVEDVFKRVRLAVSRASNGNQVPWEASSLTGDFYFQAGRPAEAAAPPTDPRALELALWDSIKDSDTPEPYESYLREHPQGSFAALARAKIAGLREPPAPPPRQQQAAAPRAAGPFYKGRFATSLPADINARLGELYLVLEIGDHRVTGWANAARDPAAVCRVGGSVNRSGGLQHTALTCGDWFRLELYGYIRHVMVDGKFGDPVGHVRWLAGDGRTGDVELRGVQ